MRWSIDPGVRRAASLMQQKIKEHRRKHDSHTVVVKPHVRNKKADSVSDHEARLMTVVFVVLVFCVVAILVALGPEEKNYALPRLPWQL